jgi:uracil-DNA glycosylase
MKDFDSSLVHSSWHFLFEPHQELISRILTEISQENFTPDFSQIFRSFQIPLDSITCLIVGQDPYPTAGHAHGLAFSTDETVKPLPKSLQNIFTELESDIGRKLPQSGDLSSWTAQGVMLLNRVLTTRVGEANAHSKLGWQKFTDAVAQELGKRDIVAVLWGKQAQELSHHFAFRIESAHPSPLSSYRGFFGSQPFSKVNEILISQGKKPIDW